LSAETQNKYIVAVIGAGPAGLFAARQLAEGGAHVVIFNRDIKPGGLAEYGIYPEKYRMKEGLRKQFRQILARPDIDYYGNVTVSQTGDMTLGNLKAAGFQALLVTSGAQGTKWLGLPGEDIPTGVYHAKDIVYHYNKLPPFSQKEFFIGNHVALVGAGNVMLDIARWLIRTVKIDEVIAVVRRGPAEVKFDKKEMEYVIANLDREALDQEVARVAPVMQAIDQDPEAAKEFILSALPKALESVSTTRFRFDFLASPVRIIGDAEGQVCGIEIEENKLVPADGDTKARGTGVKRETPVDTVIFCIGDKVDENFGLPVQWNVFVKNPDPAYPIDGLSYEAYDPVEKKPLADLFVAGWSREASSGLVGVARKDGERGARAVLQYLQTLPPLSDGNSILTNTQMLLQNIHKPVIKKEDIQRLEVVEKTEADRLMVEEFKFGTNEEMLAAMGLALETA
jgi:ferredoxin--NADP+ reductase